jgi:hypothetical protein
VALAGDPLMRPEERRRRRAQAESAQLAAMSRQAADLGGFPPAVEEKLRRQAEGKLGMRCAGCGKRIGVGLQFTRIDIVAGEDGTPTVDVARLAACNGADGCDFAERARAGADAIEMVEFVWLHGDEPVGRGQLADDVRAAEDAAAEPG